MTYQRISLSLLLILTCFSCRSPFVSSNIEKLLMEDQWTPLEYPIVWSFSRTLKLRDTIKTLEINVEKFNKLFPSQKDRSDNGITVNEGFLVDALSDLLTLFSERELPKYSSKTSELDEYLEYRLIYKQDTLIYRYSTNAVPSEVLEIDSMISIVYFPHLITTE